MTDAPVIFLICSERSGSNLIRAMLDAHPDISAPQPLHLIRDVIARADTLVHGDREGPVARAMLDHVHDSLHKQFPAAVADAVSARVAASEPFTPSQILRSLYDGIATETGSSVVMVKENELHEAAAQIIDAFPDARFIFQTRDPRDYLSSAVTLKSGAFGNKFGSFRNAMQVWAADQKFGLRMLGHFGPDRVFFQRYEDLVANPEGVLHELCGFLGLPFSPEMLEYHQKENVQEFSSRRDAWRNLARPVTPYPSGRGDGRPDHGPARLSAGFPGLRNGEVAAGLDIGCRADRTLVEQGVDAVLHGPADPAPRPAGQPRGTGGLASCAAVRE